jgi:hypothetical protein
MIVRAWIKHLPTCCIDCWSDLRHIFVGNTQVAYVRLGNSWDLRNCRKKVGETLCEYIPCFSKQCNDLPDVEDVDVIGAFIAGTMNESLMDELRHNRPHSTWKLFDITTSHASGEVVVRANLSRDTGKAEPEGGDEAN